jgi:hypothetical protein
MRVNASATSRRERAFPHVVGERAARHVLEALVRDPFGGAVVQHAHDRVAGAFAEKIEQMEVGVDALAIQLDDRALAARVLHEENVGLAARRREDIDHAEVRERARQRARVQGRGRCGRERTVAIHAARGARGIGLRAIRVGTDERYNLVIPADAGIQRLVVIPADAGIQWRGLDVGNVAGSLLSQGRRIVGPPQRKVDPRQRGAAHATGALGRVLGVADGADADERAHPSNSTGATRLFRA